jgi:ATP-dependent Clp protease adaptor protein ClpS
MGERKKIKKSDSGADVDLKDRTKSKNKVEPPKKYKCVMLNDDYTPMDFVIAVLETVFNKSPAEATRLMLDVHGKGRGIAGVYSKEIAETKCVKCKQFSLEMGHPFLVEMEPE